MKRNDFIVIEVGDHDVSVGLFEHVAESGKLRLSNHGTAPILQDATGSMAREALVATAVKKLLDEQKIKSQRAILCINGMSVFSRVVKLPPVPSERIEQTIAHEAVQNIPFPLEEVIWRYHVVDPAAVECEVVLIAIKKEIVEGLVYAIKANGLHVDRVEATPVVLANVLRMLHADLDEPVLLVDAGSKTSNLVFSNGKSRYFRILSAGSERSPDLVQEIQRSISFFKSQTGGVTPSRTFICGAGIGAAQLQQDLGIPSEPLDISALCDSRSIESSKRFAVRAGSGLALFSSPEMLLDFMPPAMKKQRQQSDQQPWWIACGVLLLLIIAIWFYGLNKISQGMKAERIAIEGEIGALENIEKKIIPVETDIQAVKANVQLYTDVIEKRRLWSNALSEIRACLPEGMFLLSSETLKELGELKGLRIEVISYLDKEPENEDVVRRLRDDLRARDLFGSGTRVFSRPSKRQFMRQFTLDVYFAGEVLE